MAMRTVLMDLKKGLIFDGATGTMLIEDGLTGGRASEFCVSAKSFILGNRIIRDDFGLL
jgi:hypothetical protein